MQNIQYATTKGSGPIGWEPLLWTLVNSSFSLEDGGTEDGLHYRLHRSLAAQIGAVGPWDICVFIWKQSESWREQFLRARHYTASLRDLFQQNLRKYGNPWYSRIKPDDWGNTGILNLTLVCWEQYWFYLGNFMTCIYSKLHVKSSNLLILFITEAIIY